MLFLGTNLEKHKEPPEKLGSNNMEEENLKNERKSCRRCEEDEKSLRKMKNTLGKTKNSV